MKSVKWDENALIVRPHKLKALIQMILFSLITVAAAFAVVFLTAWIPVTIPEKLLNVVCFTVSMVTIAFGGSAAMDGLRNIFSLPTFKVDSTNIYVCKRGVSPLSLLEKTELKKNGKLLVFTFTDGSTATLKSRLSDVPLESVNYAISLRQNSK